MDLLYTIRRVVDKPSLSFARTHDRAVGFALVLMVMSLICAGAVEAQTASTQVTEDAEGIQTPDEQFPTDPTQGELGDGPALAPLDWASAEAWADEYFSTELAANRITGAVVGAIEGDDVVFLKGYGWQDLGRQIPLDPKRTMIRMCSISKTFTASAIMQLVEEGRIRSVDDPVNPYLKRYKLPPPYGDQVTIGQLMTHSSGMAGHFSPQGTMKDIPVPVDENEVALYFR
ncbi:MAG: serine hydrolase domain-containing protein, partial [Pseudomonadota bacterium]